MGSGEVNGISELFWFKPAYGADRTICGHRVNNYHYVISHDFFYEFNAAGADLLDFNVQPLGDFIFDQLGHMISYAIVAQQRIADANNQDFQRRLILLTSFFSEL
jgi:hypothetical protein